MNFNNIEIKDNAIINYSHRNSEKREKESVPQLPSEVILRIFSNLHNTLSACSKATKEYNAISRDILKDRCLPFCKTVVNIFREIGAKQEYLDELKACIRQMQPGPITVTQIDNWCTTCEKVYNSSTKAIHHNKEKFIDQLSKSVENIYHITLLAGFDSDYVFQICKFLFSKKDIREIVDQINDLPYLNSNLEVMLINCLFDAISDPPETAIDKYVINISANRLLKLAKSQRLEDEAFHYIATSIIKTLFLDKNQGTEYINELKKYTTNQHPSTELFLNNALLLLHSKDKQLEDMKEVLKIQISNIFPPLTSNQKKEYFYLFYKTAFEYYFSSNDVSAAFECIKHMTKLLPGESWINSIYQIKLCLLLAKEGKEGWQKQIQTVYPENTLNILLNPFFIKLLQVLCEKAAMPVDKKSQPFFVKENGEKNLEPCAVENQNAVTPTEIAGTETAIGLVSWMIQKCEDNDHLQIFERLLDILPSHSGGFHTFVQFCKGQNNDLLLPTLAINLTYKELEGTRSKTKSALKLVEAADNTAVISNSHYFEGNPWLAIRQYLLEAPKISEEKKQSIAESLFADLLEEEKFEDALLFIHMALGKPSKKTKGEQTKEEQKQYDNQYKRYATTVEKYKPLIVKYYRSLFAELIAKYEEELVTKHKKNEAMVDIQEIKEWLRQLTNTFHPHETLLLSIFEEYASELESRNLHRYALNMRFRAK